ncbi:DUF2231 domain-containing protein [Dongia sedimenti]|uniref:DUF2231 domain-containing protein n=1 Tax=Dongia sedimenti TaxID=3064282 RepID=A0ABU0YTD7_9PROT|nr:DUF2231 domain-containing protein [Rhodospirillaceae bacterium R-7]
MLSVQHIHPVLVHFPIVFFITLAVVDLVAAARGRVITGRGALGNLSVGLALAAGAFAVAAYFFGDMALEFAESGGFHSDIAETHEGLGETVAVAFAIWALIRLGLWWRDLRLAGSGAFVVALVEVAGAALVVVTAYYGGQLVYDLGVNVAHAAG